MHRLNINNFMKERSKLIVIQHQNLRERRGREIRPERLQHQPPLLEFLSILKMYLNKHLNLILNHNLKYNLPNLNKIINKLKDLIRVNKKSKNNRIRSLTNNSNNNSNKSKEVKVRIKRKRVEAMNR